MWAVPDLFDLLSVGRGFGREILKMEYGKVFKELVLLVTLI